MILGFIPVNQNERFVEAYQNALAQSGGTRLTGISRSQSHGSGHTCWTDLHIKSPGDRSSGSEVGRSSARPMESWIVGCDEDFFSFASISLLLCLPLHVCLLMEHLGGGAFREGFVFTARKAAPHFADQRPRGVDLLLSGHLIGLFPQDKDLTVGGNQISNTDVRGTIGAGIKFDIYPWFTKNIVGAEIEVFGLGGSVRAPRTTSGSGTTQAQGSLIAITTMYNLMLRYSGETIQPYIGAGVGSSTGILYNVNIQSGNVGLSGGIG